MVTVDEGSTDDGPVNYEALGRRDATEAVETLVHWMFESRPLSSSQQFASSISVAREVWAAMAIQVLALKRAGATAEEQALWLEGFRRAAGEALNLAFLKVAGQA